MFRYQSSYLLLLLVSVFLSACTVVPEKDVVEDVGSEPANWSAEQQQRQHIDNWEIRGRLGLQTEQNGGTMDIIWQQAEQEYSIYLIAALGAGTYHIQGNDRFADIRYPDGRTQTIDDVENIFSSALDIDLPVSAIKDWIRGMPAESMPVDTIEWNSKGLLHRLKQSGWNVEMNKYTGSNILLPHALYLSRDDDDNLDIRLLLRQWLVDNDWQKP